MTKISVIQDRHMDDNVAAWQYKAHYLNLCFQQPEAEEEFNTPFSNVCIHWTAALYKCTAFTVQHAFSNSDLTMFKFKHYIIS